jgi:ribosomal protein L7/L12
MIIGIDFLGHLWIEVHSDVGNIVSATTRDAHSIGIRLSELNAKHFVTFSIDHTDLIKALVAMRDKKDEPIWMEHVRDFIRDKNYVGAIKRYRAATGLGLKESKDAVDALRAAEGL